VGLGDRIRAVRKELGLTQEALAQETGVSRRQVVYWEKGEEKPSADRLPVIATALGVTLEWLLTGQGLQSSEAKSLLDVRVSDIKKSIGQGATSETLNRIWTKLRTLPENDQLYLEGMIDRLLGKTDEGSGSRKTRRA